MQVTYGVSGDIEREGESEGEGERESSKRSMTPLHCAAKHEGRRTESPWRQVSDDLAWHGRGALALDGRSD